MRTVDVLVVGGSVAGSAAALAAARALAVRGGSPNGAKPALERWGTHPRNEDFTVLLWPRGVRALQQLGVVGAADIGVELEAIDYRDGEGTLLSSAPVDATAGARLVTKSAITTALLEALDALGKLGGVTVAQSDEHAQAILLHERDVECDSTVRASVIVGAGGLADPARAALFGADRRIEGGVTVVGRTPMATAARVALVPDGRPQMILGESAFLGLFPWLDETRAVQGVTWWLCVAGTDVEAPKGSQAPYAALERIFGRNFGARYQPLIDSTGPASIFVPPARTYVDPTLPAGGGRVALVGDSWRASTPDLGMGVTWALEDAVRLGRCIRERGIVPGVGAYVRESVATDVETVIGRAVSRNTSRRELDGVRRALFGIDAVPRAAIGRLASIL